MQGKGLLKAFMIILGIICLIQLFYFFPTGKVERQAEEIGMNASSGKSGVDKDAAYKAAKSRYLDSMSSEKIFSIPGITSFTYSDMKQRQLNLGLDLKGGMSLLLEVDLSEFLSIMAGRNADSPEFKKAMDQAKAAQLNTDQDLITLFTREYKTVTNGKPLASLFAAAGNLGDINIETPDNVVTARLRENANQTVDLTYKRLKTRIDRLGVAAPNISLDKARDQILVELPGVDNPERARNLVVKSAKLEFWETYRISDPGIAQALQAANDRLAGSDSTTVANAKLDSNSIKKGPLFQALNLNASGALGQTVLGLVDRNKKELVQSYLARPDVIALFPRDLKFMWSFKTSQDPASGVSSNQYELYAIKSNATNDLAPLDGSVVTNASHTLDQFTGKPEVSLAMNGDGARKWYELTKKAYEGGKREIAITLDREVVTAPGVNNGAISGGMSSISGNFNTEEAVDLANILEVGKLPANLKIVQESNVGPSLGKENINKSMFALLIGFLLVLGFMIFYYGQGGIVSIIALFLNVIFIFGILSSINTVLTLPGIAGIVLTIGMAVDANVIIYERIKEELRHGKTKWEAISSGFKASYAPIIDGNLTTIIVAFVLMYFGLGPIKGFGIVLATGIITTLLTAVLVSQFLVHTWTKEGQKEMSFYNGWSRDALTGVKFDWMGKRKYAYVFSGLLLLAGLASVFTRGFDLGVDFKGGHSYNVQFPAGSNVTGDNLSEALTKVFNASTVVKKVDTENTYNIVTAYKIDASGDQVYNDVTTKLYEGLKTLVKTNVSDKDFLKSDNNGDLKITSYSKVGATVADDIADSSWKAAIAAFILIFLYILIRFIKWQYSAGAVIATAHDALVTIGIFSLLKGLVPWSMEVDGAFVAAILTLIGYSINDTVIVFDRVREYTKLYPNMSKDEVYNAAINSTFSRTVYTSLTVFLVVVALFVFGGGSLKNFSFALLIGVAFGTYSSVFIATAIMRDLSVRFNK